MAEHSSGGQNGYELARVQQKLLDGATSDSKEKLAIRGEPDEIPGEVSSEITPHPDKEIGGRYTVINLGTNANGNTVELLQDDPRHDRVNSNTEETEPIILERISRRVNGEVVATSIEEARDFFLEPTVAILKDKKRELKGITNIDELNHRAEPFARRAERVLLQTIDDNSLQTIAREACHLTSASISPDELIELIVSDKPIPDHLTETVAETRTLIQNIINITAFQQRMGPNDNRNYLKSVSVLTEKDGIETLLKNLRDKGPELIQEVARLRQFERGDQVSYLPTDSSAQQPGYPRKEPAQLVDTQTEESPARALSDEAMEAMGAQPLSNQEQIRPVWMQKELERLDEQNLLTEKEPETSITDSKAIAYNEDYPAPEQTSSLNERDDTPINQEQGYEDGVVNSDSKISDTQLERQRDIDRMIPQLLDINSLPDAQAHRFITEHLSELTEWCQTQIMAHTERAGDAQMLAARILRESPSKESAHLCFDNAVNADTKLQATRYLLENRTGDSSTQGGLYAWQSILDTYQQYMRDSLRFPGTPITSLEQKLQQFQSEYASGEDATLTGADKKIVDDIKKLIEKNREYKMQSWMISSPPESRHQSIQRLKEMRQSLLTGAEPVPIRDLLAYRFTNNLPLTGEYSVKSLTQVISQVAQQEIERIRALSEQAATNPQIRSAAPDLTDPNTLRLLMTEFDISRADALYLARLYRPPTGQEQQSA